MKDNYKKESPIVTLTSLGGGSNSTLYAGGAKASSWYLDLNAGQGDPDRLCVVVDGSGNSFVAGNFFGKQNLEIGGDAVITGDLSVTGNFSLNTTLNANVVGDVTGDLTGNVVATGNTSRFQKVGIKTDIANIIPSADLDVTNGDAVFKNVGIGSNQPDGILDVSGSLSNATKKFILLPKVSAAGTSVLQSNSVEGGALIYNTTLRKLQFYNGDNWETVTSVEA